MAPAIFLVHVLEEAPRFVPWFNALVADGITQELFLTVNVAGFVITVGVTALAAAGGSVATALLALAWVSFLMFANAVLHIVGTLAHAQYAPGVITATLLYLPYSCWFFWRVRRQYGLSWSGPSALSLLAGLPMYVHGYLIVFRGSRLF